MSLPSGEDIFNDEAENEDEEAGEEDEAYEVEKIIDRRKVTGGKYEYYLKWKDWDDSFNTWEPEDRLQCPELLEEFNKKMDKQKKKRDEEDISQFLTDDDAEGSILSTSSKGSKRKAEKVEQKRGHRKRSKSREENPQEKKKKTTNKHVDMSLRVIISDDVENEDDDPSTLKTGKHKKRNDGPKNLSHLISISPKRPKEDTSKEPETSSHRGSEVEAINRLFESSGESGDESNSIAQSENEPNDVVYDKYGIPSRLRYREPPPKETGFVKGWQVEYVYDLIRKPNNDNGDKFAIVKFQNNSVGQLLDYDLVKERAAWALSEFYTRRMEKMMNDNEGV